MAEVVLFHHSGGLTPGVRAFADLLRERGHTVHTPDLFEGRTFADVAEGVAFAEEVGEDVFARRAAEAVAGLPAELVYGGMSFGAARAAEQALARPGARGAFFLYGAVAPSWWSATWPDAVPVQAHVAEGDPWREPEAEDELVGFGGELFVYPCAGHLFAEVGHPDLDPACAEIVRERVRTFVDGLE